MKPSHPRRQHRFKNMKLKTSHPRCQHRFKQMKLKSSRHRKDEVYPAKPAKKIEKRRLSDKGRQSKRRGRMLCSCLSLYMRIFPCPYRTKSQTWITIPPSNDTLTTSSWQKIMVKIPVIVVKSWSIGFLWR